MTRNRIWHSLVAHRVVSDKLTFSCHNWWRCSKLEKTKKMIEILFPLRAVRTNELLTQSEGKFSVRWLPNFTTYLIKLDLLQIVLAESPHGLTQEIHHLLDFRSRRAKFGNCFRGKTICLSIPEVISLVSSSLASHPPRGGQRRKPCLRLSILSFSVSKLLTTSLSF